MSLGVLNDSVGCRTVLIRNELAFSDQLGERGGGQSVPPQQV